MNKNNFSILSFLAVLLFLLTASSVAAREVFVLTLDGPITPVAAEYLDTGIKSANEEGAELLLIKLDTPGGLDTSMRSIIKGMLASEVPIAVYVSPGGARAASAGTFITIAAHVAAMAPGTNIGAASPVNLSGGMDETMAKKVTNDAAAYIRSLAEKRKRNVQWAERAVRKGDSISEQEAKRLAVIDLVADDLPDLLKKIDGRVIRLDSGREQTLATQGAGIRDLPMSRRLRVLTVLANPNLAYILMLLGFYGLFFELSNPGAIAPGVIGGISLILGFYALQVLPVNYAGLLLILLAIAMFLLELVVPTFGGLTLGGIVAMTIGSLMLFSKGQPYLRLSLAVVIPAVAATAGFFVLLMGAVVRTHRRPPASGLQSLRNEIGVSRCEFPGAGTVFIHGEIWQATSADTIKTGETVRVVSVDVLRLTVARTSDT